MCTHFGNYLYLEGDCGGSDHPWPLLSQEGETLTWGLTPCERFDVLLSDDVVAKYYFPNLSISSSKSVIVT